MNATMPKAGRRSSLWKRPALITALLLVIPLLGNQFVTGWNWGVGDFAVVGALVFGAGLAYQRMVRNAEAAAYRSALGIALVAALLLIWVNAVQEVAIYFVVPLVGILGTAIARGRPDGMSRALFVTALAQALAMVVVVRDAQVVPWTGPVLRGYGANAFFSLLFISSALLFRKAARQHAAQTT